LRIGKRLPKKQAKYLPHLWLKIACFVVKNCLFFFKKKCLRISATPCFEPLSLFLFSSYSYIYCCCSFFPLLLFSAWPLRGQALPPASQGGGKGEGEALTFTHPFGVGTTKKEPVAKGKNLLAR